MPTRSDSQIPWDKVGIDYLGTQECGGKCRKILFGNKVQNDSNKTFLIKYHNTDVDSNETNREKGNNFHSSLLQAQRQSNTFKQGSYRLP